MSADAPQDSSNLADTPASPVGPSISQSHWQCGPLRGLLLAVLGGACAWVVLLNCYPLFLIPEELRDLPAPISLENLLKQETAQVEVNRYNAIFAIGLIGAFVAAALAVGEGLSRKSLTTTLVAAVSCVVIGALFGCLAGWLGHLTLQRYRPVEDLTPLAKTIRFQCVMLATVGGGVGLGLGLSLGRQLRTMVICPIAGILAGVLAGMLYPVLAAVLMPGVTTETLIPGETGNHLLWLGLTVSLLGVVIYGMAKPPTSRGDRPEPAATA